MAKKINRHSPLLRWDGARFYSIKEIGRMRDCAIAVGFAMGSALTGALTIAFMHYLGGR